MIQTHDLPYTMPISDNNCKDKATPALALLTVEAQEGVPNEKSLLL